MFPEIEFPGACVSLLTWNPALPAQYATKMPKAEFVREFLEAVIDHVQNLMRNGYPRDVSKNFAYLDPEIVEEVIVDACVARPRAKISSIVGVVVKSSTPGGGRKRVLHVEGISNLSPQERRLAASVGNMPVKRINVVDSSKHVAVPKKRKAAVNSTAAKRLRKKPEVVKESSDEDSDNDNHDGVENEAGNNEIDESTQEDQIDEDSQKDQIDENSQKDQIDEISQEDEIDEISQEDEIEEEEEAIDEPKPELEALNQKRVLPPRRAAAKGKAVATVEVPKRKPGRPSKQSPAKAKATAAIEVPKRKPGPRVIRVAVKNKTAAAAGASNGKRGRPNSRHESRGEKITFSPNTRSKVRKPRRTRL